jgi:hypothetical protein
MTEDKPAAQSLSAGPADLGAPFLALAPTLSDSLKACRQPKHRELAHVLATVIALHDVGQKIEQFQSDDTVPVARELLGWIGQVLARPGSWSATVNKTKATIAAHRREQWQVQADEIWAQEPHLAKSEVARRIAPKESGTVRRRIEKKLINLSSPLGTAN